MKAAAQFLALDLGAESGRAVVGRFDGERLALKEVHRFPNGPVRVLDSLHWDVLRLWSEVQRSVGLAVKAHGDGLASVGVDTWGVDFCLLGADDALLGNPYHYRDHRTDGMIEESFRRMPREEIYAQTGIQFIQLNSLYQLLAMARAQAPALAVARTLLMMPDLFHFWLSGIKANEFTDATTTQCYDPRAGRWAFPLLERLGIPTAIFGALIQPGTVLGPLRPVLAEELGAPRLQVVVPGSHDTASAVAAVPLSGYDAIFLSSGTWSLIGIERREPLITEQGLAYNLSNEGGVCGTIRLLRNVTGLWLVQECRREWAQGGQSLSYDELTAAAAAAPAFGSLIVAGDPRFLAPGGIPGRIQDYCRETGQAVPQTQGEIVRCVLESLACDYRRVAAQLDDVAGRRLPTLHIVGGGSQNRLLNQLAADATGRAVVAGPVEATAIGNLLLQALSLGHIRSLAEGRDVVRRSFAVETYEPRNAAAWDEAYARYERLLEARQ